jgi:hypothetical protein
MPSDRYQGDSEDYYSEREDRETERLTEPAGGRAAAERPKPPWDLEGFASLEEWGADQERRSPGGRLIAAQAREMRAAELPEGRVPPKGMTRTPYVRQINVRLSIARFEELELLASDYGVAPSTMAWLLINNSLISMGRGD